MERSCRRVLALVFMSAVHAHTGASLCGAAFDYCSSVELLSLMVFILISVIVRALSERPGKVCN